MKQHVDVQAFECSMKRNHGSGARTAGSPVDTSLDSVGSRSGAQAWSFPLFFGFGFLRRSLEPLDRSLPDPSWVKCLLDRWSCSSLEQWLQQMRRFPIVMMKS